MNREQAWKCREREIQRMAERLDGDTKKAASLYNRCIRYTLRYKRWGERQCNGGMTKMQQKIHDHEGKLIAELGKRLGAQLAEYGLSWEYPGLYPVLIDENGNMGIDLLYL